MPARPLVQFGFGDVFTNLYEVYSEGPYILNDQNTPLKKAPFITEPWGIWSSGILPRY